MSVEKLIKRFEEVWQEEKATEVASARDAIIDVLKKNRTSLPAAVFALDLVKMELVRAQLEEFLGHVQLTKELPLKKSE
jgi:predicted DNA-binding protein YlxM (UPF0122 family)